MRPVKRLKRNVRSVYYRTRYPDLYDDALLKANLDGLGPQVRGRSLALVGNAQSIFARRDGAAIDGCDQVMRLNRGFLRHPASQGARTDLLCLSLRLSRAEIRAAFGDVPIVYGNQDRWVMAKDMWAERNSIAYYPIEAFRALSARIGRRRPSTGLIAIDLLLSCLGAAQVRLFGFDWKRTRTFYEPELNYNVHDWIAERELIGRWAGEGRIVLPPIVPAGPAGPEAAPAHGRPDRRGPADLAAADRRA